MGPVIKAIQRKEKRKMLRDLKKAKRIAFTQRKKVSLSIIVTFLSISLGRNIRTCRALILFLYQEMCLGNKKTISKLVIKKSIDLKKKKKIFTA